MNITRFSKNIRALQNILLDSRFLQELKGSAFPDKELAQIGVQLTQMAIQASLNLEELEYKNREIALNEEKVRQDMENSIKTAIAQSEAAKAEAFKSVVQSHMMLKAGRDNAAINKSNAMVGFLTAIATGAGNLSSQKDKLQAIYEEILKIDSNILPIFDEPIYEMIKNGRRNIQTKDGGSGVFILASKIVGEIGETLRISGGSVYQDDEAYFIIYKDDEEIERVEGKALSFMCSKLGVYKIEFVVNVSINKYVVKYAFMKESSNLESPEYYDPQDSPTPIADANYAYKKDENGNPIYKVIETPVTEHELKKASLTIRVEDNSK